jgi:hypothetical protein
MNVKAQLVEIRVEFVILTLDSSRKCLFKCFCDDLAHAKSTSGKQVELDELPSDSSWRILPKSPVDGILPKFK